LSPSFGVDFRLEPDLDRIEALSTERAALWARVDSASFLDRNEKRQAVGYGVSAIPELESIEADIAIVDMADEAGMDDPEAEINKLKARLYDLHIKYEGQPRDDAGRFSFGAGPQKIDPKNYAKVAMSPACFSEWLEAKKLCELWINSPNSRGYSTGGYKDINKCAKGLVSMACGGNTIRG
jgi:hypothetical protein